MPPQLRLFYYGVLTMSAKKKGLAYLSKDGDYNTLTATKMHSVFGIKNPSAVINE